MSALHVAVGLLLQQQQVLIARRAKHKHQGGKWEFPGGKIEPGESALVALVRELQEEVGVTPSVDQALHLVTLTHSYPDLSVTLHCYLLPDFSGVPQGLEGQDICWAALADLDNFAFPDANQDIIAALRLALPLSAE